MGQCHIKEQFCFDLKYFELIIKYIFIIFTDHRNHFCLFRQNFLQSTLTKIWFVFNFNNHGSDINL